MQSDDLKELNFETHKNLSAITMEKSLTDMFIPIEDLSLWDKISSWLFGTIQTCEREIHSQGKIVPSNFASNKICNRKYNILTLLPKFLYNEYSQFINFFYLMTALLQFIPALWVGFLISYISPLLFVLTISFIREVVDELRWIVKDKVINGQQYQVIKFNRIKYQASASLWVGDIVVVKQGQRVPADMALLYCYDKEGSSYVKTDQLDGETDWKYWEAIKITQNIGKENIYNLYKESWRIRCEKPSKELYSFVGSFLQRETGESFPLHLQNTIWQNMTLQCIDVIGMVIYSGKECRIQQNLQKPKTKYGATDKEVNQMTKLFFFMLLIFSSSLMVLSMRVKQNDWWIYLIRAFLILSYVIPVSMRVNLDLAKIKYSLEINRDQELPQIQVRNSNNVEELGWVQFLLSDKTGTLTKNIMKFRVMLGLQFSIFDKRTSELKVLMEELFKEDFWKDPKKNTQYLSLVSLLICNNVSPIEQNGQRVLQSSSPDEISFVEFIEQNGLKIVQRTQQEIQIKYQDIYKETFKILFNVAFDSQWKRMNIIVQSLNTNNIYLLTKGADQIVSNFVDFEAKIFIEEKGGELSKEGLWTLIFCYKEINSNVFESFDYDYQNASKNLKTMKQRQQRLFDVLEQDQVFLGLTGIEDELQDNIKMTISTFREAQIKVWMLTGDKLETSKCIALSTDIKNKDTDFYLLEFTSQSKFLYQLMNMNPSKSTLIIQGDCLSKVLDDTLILEWFMEKALMCESVVVCRCDPRQKAQITKIIKQNGNIVCSVGDGGNDVGMIQEANIGIGIEGFEGKQAALASDVSIFQFKDLQKLILHYGRISFYRSTALVSFVFYRGSVMFFIQIFFMLSCYYIPISLYNPWLTMFYVTLFTNLAVLSLICDVDLTYQQLQNYPILYTVIQQYHRFTVKSFLLQTLKALYQAIVIYSLSQVFIENYFTKIATCTFTALIFIQLLNIFTKVKRFTIFISFSILLSITTYTYSLIYLKSFFMLSYLGWFDMLIIFCVVTIAWLPFQLFKWLRFYAFPNFIDKIVKESTIQKRRNNLGQNIKFQ